MKVVTRLMCACLVIFGAAAFAADATGKWAGEVKLPTGQSLPFIAHLMQNGNAVTGRLEGINGAPDVEVTDGKVDKGVITFSGVRKINGVDVKFNYTGTLIGDSIAFKIVRADGGGAALETLTKRVKE